MSALGTDRPPMGEPTTNAGAGRPKGDGQMQTLEIPALLFGAERLLMRPDALLTTEEREQISEAVGDVLLALLEAEEVEA